MKKNEKKDLKYFSTDKVYNVKTKKKLSPKAMSYLLLLVGLIVLLLSADFLSKGLDLSKKVPKVGYTETGKADYNVYLKENNYYDTKSLPSGMQYVASLINTINTKFNYEIITDEKIDFNYTYKVVGDLQIVDSTDENKVIYSKEYSLLDDKQDTIKTDHLVINEDVDVDYAKFNNYVNSYKKDYGLSANSRLVVTMTVNATGKQNDSTETLQKSNKLQITVPLSEQTLGVAINTENINNKGVLTAPNNNRIKSFPLMVSGLGLLIVGLLLIYFAIKFHKEYVKENIYTLTVKKILRDYDRLIVNGNINVDEHKFANKIIVDKFSEMVDASQNLGAPILFYDVIPGEKCFFIIIQNDVLYKYRLTKAYLQREELEKKQKVK